MKITLPNLEKLSPCPNFFHEIPRPYITQNMYFFNLFGYLKNKRHFAHQGNARQLYVKLSRIKEAAYTRNQQMKDT